jgi:FkbM family methyltransferase
MLKYLVKAAARAVGFDLQRFHPATSQVAQRRAMLAHHGINLILDVGANVGQYGFELRREIGYTGRIVSFEPMRSSHEALCRAAARDPRWEVARRAAIGAVEGNVTLNISSNLVSSSVLPMLSTHAAVAPASRYVDTEVVPVTTLDAIAPEYLRPDSVTFLKIDTQGYESEVLDGAARTLEHVLGLQLELSIVPLYGGQKLMPELLSRVSALGFDLWGANCAFADSSSGRTLQIDATFFRVPATHRQSPRQS